MKFQFFAPMLTLLLFSVASLAQAPTEPLFPKVFPQPTGKNGLEEIIMAGDLLASSQALKDFELLPNKPNLVEKRTIVSNAMVSRAIKLYRSGLRKRLEMPKADELSKFAGHGYLRRIAWLLTEDSYVLLADGKTSLAIDDMEGVLELSRIVQSDRLMGGLSGALMDAYTLRSIVQHMDQMSEPDSKRLMSISKEWLSAPDSSAKAFAMGREDFMGELEPLLESIPKADAEQAREWANNRVAQIAEHIKKPFSERQPLPPREPIGVGPELVAALDSLNALERSFLTFAKDRARVQELGVHAAIHKWKWDHDQLPESLTQLSLGNMIIDPFTDQRMIYKKKSENTYELIVEGLIRKPVLDDPTI
ncbi:MAG: hypothetical protein ABJA67_09200 [Chthonomonadales bacterium]